MPASSRSHSLAPTLPWRKVGGEGGSLREPQRHGAAGAQGKMTFLYPPARPRTLRSHAQAWPQDLPGRPLLLPLRASADCWEKAAGSACGQAELQHGARGACPEAEQPPDQLLHIISFLTLPDVLRLGQTCRYFHEVCDGEATWHHLCTPLCPAAMSARPCKRATILSRQD
ncbi:PREDICTED: F-box only protein 24 [Nipponia nippon]|uniref:F-box only protein 24 n=1 Tax=Nipponia nippon TaxID=128390 RepID=UPI0005114F53|nr:PREDICTED: F-box only protein 24 [Nipponia nippon]